MRDRLVALAAMCLAGAAALAAPPEPSPRGASSVPAPAASLAAEPASPPPALPEGNAGLAARYPGDVGIAKAPAVLFADGFEGAAAPEDLARTWDAVYHAHCTRIAEEPENVHAGRRALEFRVPRQAAALHNTAAKQFKDEQDVVFLRFYSKLEKGFDMAGGGYHTGGTISAHYFTDGQASAGVRADGRNKFLAGFESERQNRHTPSPGPLNVYCYHPEQRDVWGDHFFPTGTVVPFSSRPHPFGPHFVARPDVAPALDRWYCYEFMVKANTVGRRDGRIACWVDGKMIADFTNLRLRDVADLKINWAAVDLHIKSSPIRQNKKYYDDVVIATSYIGPVKNE